MAKAYCEASGAEKEIWQGLNQEAYEDIVKKVDKLFEDFFDRVDTSLPQTEYSNIRFSLNNRDMLNLCMYRYEIKQKRSNLVASNAWSRRKFIEDQVISGLEPLLLRFIQILRRLYPTDSTCYIEMLDLDGLLRDKSYLDLYKKPGDVSSLPPFSPVKIMFVSGFIMEGKTKMLNSLDNEFVEDEIEVVYEPTRWYRASSTIMGLSLLELGPLLNSFTSKMIILRYVFELILNIVRPGRSSKVLFERWIFDHMGFAGKNICAADQVKVMSMVMKLVRAFSSVEILMCHIAERALIDYKCISFYDNTRMFATTKTGFRWPLTTIPGREFEVNYYSSIEKLRASKEEYWLNYFAAMNKLFESEDFLHDAFVQELAFYQFKF